MGPGARCADRVDDERQYDPQAIETGFCKWGADEPRKTATDPALKFFIATDVSTMSVALSRMPIQCRTMYESITPETKVKPYADIDWYKPYTGKCVCLRQ